MINAQDLVNKFQQALSEQWGYIWGTAGELWTAIRQQNLEKTTDTDRALGRKYGKKWIGHKVADCSGLFSWAFRQLGGTMYHGSDTMYRKWCVEKGELKAGKRTDFATLKPGTAVFIWNGKKYTHVGLFVGGETVIEAQGTLAGVTTSKVSATKWTHWGELTGVEYGTIPGSVTAPGSASSPRPTLRRGAKGEAVRALQSALLSLGYSLSPYGADGDFGKVTEAAVRRFQQDHALTVDGICGPQTWAALDDAPASAVTPESAPAPENAPAPESPSASATYAVRIGGLDLTQALLNNYPGSTMEQEGA